MTIHIQDAIKAVKINIAWCDAVDPIRWDESECEIPYPDECRFAIAARAGYKATLEYLLRDLYWNEDRPGQDEDIQNAVRPLVDHLDATRPGWRTE